MPHSFLATWLEWAIASRGMNEFLKFISIAVRVTIRQIFVFHENHNIHHLFYSTTFNQLTLIIIQLQTSLSSWFFLFLFCIFFISIFTLLIISSIPQLSINSHSLSFNYKQVCLLGFI